MTIIEMTRTVLVAACVLSSASALYVAIVTHPRYTPLMLLVSFWSLVVAIALTDIYIDSWQIPGISDRLFRASFNTSSTVMVGGWALFGVWVGIDANRLRKAIPAIIDADLVPLAAAVEDLDSA